MKEPILIAELLISGLLTLTWLALGLAFFVQPGSIFGALPNFSLSGTLILALYCYIVGIVTDRIWDLLTKPTDRRIRRKYFESDEELSVIRSQVLASSAESFQFFDYIRMRMRVIRAVVCNAPLILIATALLLWKAGGLLEPGAIFILVVLALFVLCANYAFRRITRNYYEQLKHASDGLAQERDQMDKRTEKD